LERTSFKPSTFRAAATAASASAWLCTVPDRVATAWLTSAVTSLPWTPAAFMSDVWTRSWSVWSSGGAAAAFGADRDAAQAIVPATSTAAIAARTHIGRLCLIPPSSSHGTEAVKTYTGRVTRGMPDVACL
jgi:hypothetical protein